MKLVLKVRMTSVAIWFLLSLPAAAQPLWQATAYGMSVEEVRTAVQGVVPPPKPERLANGAQELLRLENVDLVNRRFAVRFFFKDGKLEQVTISLETGHTLDSAMLSFDSLTESLRAKYGHELNREIKRGILNSAQSTWLAGRTNITLFLVSVGENDAMLNLNYQVRLAQEADKL